MNRCPKCQSPNIYEEGIDYACMMCGTRWSKNGTSVIIPVSMLAAQNKTKEQTMAINTNRIRPCRNCGRTKAIQADGLCGSCNNAVYKKFTKGTPEYNAALAEIKKRVSDPNFGRGYRKATPRTKVPAKISPDNVKKIKTHVRALKIKHNGGDPEMAGVIATMQMERERLLAKADKLKQAINLLS